MSFSLSNEECDIYCFAGLSDDAMFDFTKKISFLIILQMVCICMYFPNIRLWITSLMTTLILLHLHQRLINYHSWCFRFLLHRLIGILQIVLRALSYPGYLFSFQEGGPDSSCLMRSCINLLRDGLGLK